MRAPESSLLRLRQICLVAADLDSVEDDLKAILGLEVAFRDPGLAQFGLGNVMLPIGDNFLEVVSPFREHTTAGRFLERRGTGLDPGGGRVRRPRIVRAIQPEERHLFSGVLGPAGPVREDGPVLRDL